jgi:ribosome-associated protein
MTSAPTDESVPVPASEEAIALAVAAATAADDKKATDLSLLDVADVLGLVDVFLLVSAGSDRQLKAVAEGIEDRLREADRRILRKEGDPAGGWVLLDFGDLVCHLFSTEQRDFYGLERLWADVPRRDPLDGSLLPGRVPLSGALAADRSEQA